MAQTQTHIGAKFQNGHKNPVSRVFACVGCEQSGQQNTIPLSAGETFPPYRKCNGAVMWKLIRYA